jgi:hypothetical protein
MFKRLWVVLSIIWAGLIFAAGNGDAPMEKMVAIAFGPAIVVAVLWRAGRWVGTGR